MSAHRTIITKPGKIRGMNLEADCKVMATEVDRPGFPIAYAKMSIHDVSVDLPDGSCEVSCFGQTSNVKKQNGRWLGAW